MTATPGPGPRAGSSLDGARVAVVGLGASGRAAVDVLATLGARVRGYDGAERGVAAAEADPAVPAGTPLEHAADPAELAARALGEGGAAGTGHRPDIVVVSPGIPAHAPIHTEAARLGVPVWSEIELAWQVQAPLPGGGYAPWLALTGTNGKTTTVSMLATILATAGERAPAVGTVGTPAARVAAAGGVDALPAELSSFQLHATHSLAPEASVVLNVAPDHLDWHGGYANYAADKSRVYARTTRACLYTPDARTRAMVEDAEVADGCLAVGIGFGAPGVGEIGVVDGILCERAFEDSRWHAAQELATLDDLAHLAPGGGDVPPHLLLDALVAAGLARAHGVPPAAVRDGLRAYAPGEHRIATVAQIGGVTWVDDSKATNAHAADASLRGVAPGRCVWIAGGLAKGATFEDLVERRADRLRAAVLIGVDREPLRRALAARAPHVPVVEIETAATGGAPSASDPSGPAAGSVVMERAVAAAARLAQPGDTVLLAPACASMDLFDSYAERGRSFAEAVHTHREAGA